MEMDMKNLWSALDQGVVSSIVSSEVGDCEEAGCHQQENKERITSLTQRHFSFFLLWSVLWEKERTRCPKQLLEILDDDQLGSISGLHEGDCGACLAAEVCNHPCCHDWFLEIGLRL